MDKLWTHCGKWSKSDTVENHGMRPHLGGPQNKKFRETAGSVGVARGWGQSSVWEDDKLLEMDTGDGWPTL